MGCRLTQNETQSSTVTALQPLTEAEMISRIIAGERELFYDLIKPCERAVFLTAYLGSEERGRC